MSDYLFSCILIASSFTAGWILYFFVAFLIKRRDAPSSKLFKLNLGILKSPLRFLIPVLCVAGVMPLLRLPVEAHLFIGNLIRILLIALFGWVAIKIAYIVRDALLERYDMNTRDNIHARSVHTQMRLITNIIAVVIVLLTVSFVLMSFSEVRHIGVSILASAGVVGIVIGLSLIHI